MKTTKLMADAGQKQKYNISRNFLLWEFRCKGEIVQSPKSEVQSLYEICPWCMGNVVVSLELVAVLQAIRDAVEAPVIITSGYRCPEMNRVVGGVPNSKHLTGEAADIAITKEIEDKIEAVKEVVFRGKAIIIINYKRKYIHIQI